MGEALIYVGARNVSCLNLQHMGTGPIYIEGAVQEIHLDVLGDQDIYIRGSSDSDSPPPRVTGAFSGARLLVERAVTCELSGSDAHNQTLAWLASNATGPWRYNGVVDLGNGPETTLFE